MKVFLNPDREIGRRSPMLYGQFIEHFHRQIYGGVYDPQSPFADEDGFRTDVLEAMRRIKMPFCAGREAVLYPPTTGRTQWEKKDSLFLTKPGVWRIRTPSVRMNT